MPRPKLNRTICHSPSVTYFKPRGIPVFELGIVKMTAEEVEALRLKNVNQLSQTECAEKMNTSQSTLQRILSSAYNKMSDAIVNGKAIEIIN